MNRNDSLKFVIDNYREAYYKLFPIKNSKLVDEMFNNSCRNIGVKGFSEVIDYLNSLKYPLTLYRGLVIKDEKDLNLDDIGINWTIDKNLFSEYSSFKNCNYIVKTEVNEEQVDFPETIQNYLHYSYKLKEKTGKYPEKEIVLKESPNKNKVEIIEIKEN